METKINIIKNYKNPKVLVTTPLLPGHKISKETKKTIKRNDVDFMWISCENNQNIPKNHSDGLKWFKNKFGKLPDYIQFIDNDVVLGRKMLDRLYENLIKSEDNIGYCYASFEFKGTVNAKFPAIPYDINKLIQCNYISSNSMFKSEIIEKVGLVTDDKYKRLLDYAFLLKLYKNGYIGTPEPNAWFVAYSDEKSVSAGSQDDYRVKYKRVYDDFIVPLINKA